MRIKRSSPILVNAIQRHVSVQAIDPEYDLGNNMTSQEFQLRIDKANEALNNYNNFLSKLDEKLNILEACEGDVAEFHAKLLYAVMVKFGKDSIEYESAGGVRISDRKKIVRKPIEK